MDVTTDITKVSQDDYAALIMAANYASVRLRYFAPPPDQPAIPSAAMVATAPAVAFFARPGGPMQCGSNPVVGISRTRFKAPIMTIRFIHVVPGERSSLHAKTKRNGRSSP